MHHCAAFGHTALAATAKWAIAVHVISKAASADEAAVCESETPIFVHGLCCIVCCRTRACWLAAAPHGTQPLPCWCHLFLHDHGRTTAAVESNSTATWVAAACVHVAVHILISMCAAVPHEALVHVVLDALP